MRSVRISLKTARALADFFVRVQGADCFRGEPATVAGFQRLARELGAAMEPKRSIKLAKTRKTAKKKTKREEAAAVREVVAARANGTCECGCGHGLNLFGGTAEMDHFEGISRSETVETCWMLRSGCHRDKHRDGEPGKWRAKFILHCLKHGYEATAKRVAAKVAADALIAEASQLSRGEAADNG